MKKTRILGLLAGLVVAGLLTAGGYALLRTYPPDKHVSTHEMFNGEVRITRTETTQTREGTHHLLSVKLDIQIDRPGNYVFEGWSKGWRREDALGEKWEYTIPTAPAAKARNFRSLVYRLEAARATGKNKLERGTALFEHHSSDATFNGTLKPREK